MARTANKTAQSAQSITVSDSASKRADLAKLIKELNSLFIDRKELILGILTAYVAKTNIFAGGPPGTGKTMLGKTIAQAFDSRTFYYLMSSTTQPDEILGGTDLAALQHKSEFRRDLTGKLADCELAILDEGFKANSPCLNALLGLILDKEIVNGHDTVRVPLQSMLVCSNELPQEDILAPFWDRLALRYWVDNLSPRGNKELMMRAAGLKPTPEITVKFSMDDLARFQLEAQEVAVSEDVIDCILEITKQVSEQGVKPSSRKFVQLIHILKSYAYVSGANEVTEEHLELLEFILWNEHDQRKPIATVCKAVAEAQAEALNNIFVAAQQVVSKIWEIPSSDTGKLKLYLHTADSKLQEMISQVRKSANSAAPGSRKDRLASKILADLENMREKQILKSLADLEF